MSTFHRHGITAIWHRQLGSLLGNPLGYVFIFAFVVISSLILFWPDNFYSRNIADLGPLFTLMPWLLVILLPSLSMGSWSTEREQGTEELLLTLPLGVVDALLGKYLAVVSYFTLALVCSLTNVVVLKWLGSPDTGLIVANYVGWWLAGISFAALGLLASVQVGSSAIAFVLGAIYCGIVMWGANAVNWFDAFNRGVIPLSGVISALAVAVASFAMAVLILASRRWRAHTQNQVIAQVLSMIFALILAVNVARVAGRHNIDADISSEGLSSISAESEHAISSITQPVTIAAFISENLPPDLQIKGKEVEDKLRAVERKSHGKVTVEIRHPVDAADAAGTFAEQHYGVKPFKTVIDTVSGHDDEDVFLGAAVVSGGRSQVIGSFDPGLSVEFELVRAVRSVAELKKKVLGIATTDLKMTSDFNFQTYQTRPAWGITDEWKKQYDIREVNLDSDVAKEVDVLVVPLPSSLTQPQVEHLHDYIWNGRPALLLEDPMLCFGDPQLSASLPKRSNGNPYQPNPDAPQKGDLKPLYHALGLDFDLSMVVWSEFNPSHQLRGPMPPEFVWLTRSQHGVLDSTVTTGIDTMLLPFPGAIVEASDKRPDLTVTRLLQPCENSLWGELPLSEYLQQGMMGMQQRKPTRHPPGDPAHPPALAVEITGTMGSAYAEPDASGPRDPKVKQDNTKVVTGVPSRSKVHVIVVADTDLAENQFFELYRSAGSQASAEDRDKFADVFSLRNVQFLANAVDTLFGEQAFLEVRNRHPQRRPLTRLEDVLDATTDHVHSETERAQNDEETAKKRAEDGFEDKIRKVDTRTDLDGPAKENLKQEIRDTDQHKLDEEVRRIDEIRDARIKVAKIEQRREISQNRARIKFYAIGTPSLVMLLLVLTIFANRLRVERANVPPKRKRNVA